MKRQRWLGAVILVLTPGLLLAAAWPAATTPRPAVLSAYHGSIHNHTGYSDGQGTPDLAFTTGRANGLEFMAITDHSETLDGTEWLDTLAQANSHTVPGTFIAMRGCEWSHSTQGHVNVYGTDRRPVVQSYGYPYTDLVPTLADLYVWLSQHPESWAEYNHPTYIPFDWTYVARAEGAMQLLEVGWGVGGNYRWDENKYVEALDAGWRVAPTLSADTHTSNWGSDNPGRAGIWATELTTAGVMEALTAMRTFATEDGNLELSLQCDGNWMGQRVLNDGALDCLVYVYDPDGEATANLALYTNGRNLVAQTTPPGNPYTWAVHVELGRASSYYFARAQQADGNRAVTAPIWAEDLTPPVHPTPQLHGKGPGQP